MTLRRRNGWSEFVCNGDDCEKVHRTQSFDFPADWTEEPWPDIPGEPGVIVYCPECSRRRANP